MYYDAISNEHGLPHDPFKAIVAPRPIGWISTLSKEGVPNLAPYSFFNAIASDPNIVLFSSTGWKDSVQNVEDTGEFVCSLATWDLREQMNTTSAMVPSQTDEFRLSGLTPAPSTAVKPARVAESPVALECKHLRTLELRDLTGEPAGYLAVIGQVVGVYIDDAALRDGILDLEHIKPIARCGYRDYALVDELFQMSRPSAST